MQDRFTRFLPRWIVAFAWMASAGAAGCPIMVPNGSFEDPQTPFVSTFISSWQEFPKPPWYDESGPFLWDQVTGVFKNTPPGSVDHLVNCDGAQAAYLFAEPEVGFFQDYGSYDWNDPEPTRAFDVRYQAGQSYRLTVGVVGGGGNMLDGVTLELSLYFRDDANQVIPVAVTTVTNSPTLTPGRTNLADFSVVLPVVKPTDPWAGRHIGIQILSTVSFELRGGYWDVDHVRLEAIPESVPTLKVALTESDLLLSWTSLENALYQLEIATTPDSWEPYGDPLTGTGCELVQRIPTGDTIQAFFRVVSWPDL